ncbi:uncharacterized protein PgNI_09268 [Pyricularia grisea]|uniref:Uncharacterized protein n=1 Tax=Pyricularia grisea TaxID=148305 RepID=A0A6P8ASD3_PYRGI|nr:uncharacterized protein PgNI_09268 [Pyricularia grisea]TLD05007.1 hypothetical protein PgNI_09268 [Pyricularia grisea]
MQFSTISILAIAAFIPTVLAQNTCKCAGKASDQSSINDITKACCVTASYSGKVLEGTYKSDGTCDYSNNSQFKSLSADAATSGFSACCKGTTFKEGSSATGGSCSK